MSRQTTPLSKSEVALRYVKSLGMTEREVNWLIDRLIPYAASMSGPRVSDPSAIHDKVNFSR